MKTRYVLLMAFMAVIMGSITGPASGAWVYIYDTETPPDGEPPGLGDDRIREKAAAWQERMNVDHYLPLTGTQVSDAAAGQHRQIEFYGPIDTPTAATNKGWVYTKDVNSVVEFYWLDESDNELQLTSYGQLKVVTASIADANVTTAKIADSAVTFAKLGCAKDEDDMVSDSNVHIPTQQSVKKYVDDQIPAATSAAKAWVQFNSSGTIQGTGYNVASVARNSTGNYTITWDTDFANDDYVVIAVGLGVPSVANEAVVWVNSVAVGSCVVKCSKGYDATLKDLGMSIVAFGTQ